MFGKSIFQLWLEFSMNMDVVDSDDHLLTSLKYLGHHVHFCCVCVCVLGLLHWPSEENSDGALFNQHVFACV